MLLRSSSYTHNDYGDSCSDDSDTISDAIEDDKSGSGSRTCRSRELDL
jgi:hypothetical protein